MLYAHAYYSEQDFWEIYDREWYNKLRGKYNAEGIFPDIWFKTHVSLKRYSVHMLKGMFRIFLETLHGRNLK